MVVATCIAVIWAIRVVPKIGMHLHVDEGERGAFAFSVATLLMLVLLVAYNQAGGIFLQYDYYFYYFVPYFVLCVASVFIGANTRQLGPIAVTIFLAMIIAAAVSRVDGVPWLYAEPTNFRLSMLLASGVGVCAVALTTGLNKQRWLIFVTGALVVGATLLQRPSIMGADLWQHTLAGTHREKYAEMREAMSFLTKQHFTDVPLFWIDSRETPEMVASYSPAYMFCGFNSFPTVNPDIWFRPGRSFDAGDDIVLVSGRRHIEYEAKVGFRSLGVTAQETAKDVIPYPGGKYDVIVYHVTARDAAPLFKGFLQPTSPTPGAKTIQDVYSANDAAPSAESLTVPQRRQVVGPLWILISVGNIPSDVSVSVMNEAGTETLYQATIKPGAPRTVVVPIQLLDKPGNIVMRASNVNVMRDIRIYRIEVRSLRAD